MNRQRKLIGLLAVLILALAACGGEAEEPAAGDDGEAGGDETAAAGDGEDGGTGGGEPIVIGGIFDLTGATGDVGTPYAEGVRAYVEQANADGGIQGREIDLQSQDYQYDVAIAEQLYSQYAGAGAVAILGWGTADTEALRSRVTSDEIPFFSGSLSEELADPEETPYNFLVGTTYSDQMRIALQHINEETGGDAEIAVFHNDSPFGLSPVEDGRNYIEEQGYGFGYEAYPMPGGATDYVALLTRAQDQGATHIIIQNVASPAAQLVQNIAGQGLDVQTVCLNWCTDELFVDLAGEDAEGVKGVTPWAPATVDNPGVETVLEAGDVSEADVDGHFLQGWYYIDLLATAIGNVIEAGDEVTGPNIATMLEEMEPFETGGVSPPIDFTEESHKGMLVAPIFQVTDGEWTQISEPIKP
jgi:branched-chain amino acid transport system substrate-binding protein